MMAAVLIFTGLPASALEQRAEAGSRWIALGRRGCRGPERERAMTAKAVAARSAPLQAFRLTAASLPRSCWTS